MTAVCTGPVTTNFLAFPSNLGVSDSAKQIGNLVVELHETAARTVTIGRHYTETPNKLKMLEQSGDTLEDRDAYGAKGMDIISYTRAIRFSQLLPMSVPVPEVYVDTDGEVRFEWYKGPRQVFSVAVRPNGELAYAGLFGASKTHGQEYLDDELPGVILDNIQRACPDGICLATAE